MSGSMPESTSESMRHEERDTNEAGALPSNKRNRRFRDDANNRGTTKRRKDMGRNEWRRASTGKRDWNTTTREEGATSKKTAEDAETGVPASVIDQTEQEARRPKRKVAVMIGYCGSGYRGLQVNGDEKTIERDLFAAFVASGAISRANSNDPKKSSLVRCARTDKGVHAAGNVLSLKLIIEDSDIVEKINQHLPPQIRVWGIERTTGSFSCYNLCDARIYEYLIPTHALLPPHPGTYLGRKMKDSAKERGTFAELEMRQSEVLAFWDDAEEKFIRPAMKSLDPSIQESALAAVFRASETDKLAESETAVSDHSSACGPENTMDPNEPTNYEAAVRTIKLAYLEAKKSYRISPTRLDRLREALSAYVGTYNFHNYTIQKSYKDASAKRHIKSFTADGPIMIRNTEWLSLKVEGQSFMMHQIRKMVSMATLIVRMGCPLERIHESYGPRNFRIPKAPGLGLLLERPLFDAYNKLATERFQRQILDFDKYKGEIEEFKHKYIYEHIFEKEEKENIFHDFFNYLDQFDSDQWLHFTSADINTMSRLSSTQGAKDADRLDASNQPAAADNGTGEGMRDESKERVVVSTALADEETRMGTDSE